MTNQLRIEVAASESLAPATHAAVLALCNEAFEEELASLFATFVDPVHVLAYLGDALVSHAMWITRSPPDGAPANCGRAVVNGQR